MYGQGIISFSLYQDNYSYCSLIMQGGVGLRIRVYDRIMCFVNCHLAAHLEAVNRRNADFDHIYRNMVFSRTSTATSGNGEPLSLLNALLSCFVITCDGRFIFWPCWPLHYSWCLNYYSNSSRCKCEIIFTLLPNC